MEENKEYRITIKNNERELSLTLSWDADIFEWIENFKTILHWLTFAHETIEEQFTCDDE